MCAKKVCRFACWGVCVCVGVCVVQGRLPFCMSLFVGDGLWVYVYFLWCMSVRVIELGMFA